MNKESYSIPQGITTRYEFGRNTFELCNSHAAAWGIPAEKLIALADVKSSYELKYGLAANPSTRSQAIIADRDAAWLPYSALLSDLYNHNLLHNDAISAADKAALHLNQVGGNTNTPTPAQTSTPIVSLVSEEISVLHVVYSDSATPASHSKPSGAAFCELWAKLDGATPTGTADCPLRYNISRSHDGIVFEPAARGKNFSGYARWVNKNGKTGPFSSLFTAIVP